MGPDDEIENEENENENEEGQEGPQGPGPLEDPPDCAPNRPCP